MDEAKAIDDVLNFIKRSVKVELASVMTKDLLAVSNLTTIGDNAISGWRAWRTFGEVHEGVQVADATDLKSIETLLECRLEEQNLLLHEYQRGITCALAATQTEWDELRAKAKHCDDDKASLVNVLRAFNWQPGKLKPSHLRSVFNSIIQLSLERELSIIIISKRLFRRP